MFHKFLLILSLLVFSGCNVTSGSSSNEETVSPNIETELKDKEIVASPEVETPTPEAGTPTPEAETPTPEAETPTPEAETPTPEVEIPAEEEVGIGLGEKQGEGVPTLPDLGLGF